VTNHLDAATALLARSPLIDGHNDLPWQLRKAGPDAVRTDIAAPVSFTHTDLPRLAQGKVGAQFWSVFVPVTLAGEAAVATTLEQIDFVRSMVRPTRRRWNSRAPRRTWSGSAPAAGWRR